MQESLSFSAELLIGKPWSAPAAKFRREICVHPKARSFAARAPATLTPIIGIL
jgi:hypothetical protein